MFKHVLPLIAIITLFSNNLSAQNTITLYNIEKFDKVFLPCHDSFLSNVQTEIVLFKDSIVLDTVFYTSERPLLANDTIFYKVQISKALYLESDSLLLKPTYNLWCSDGSSKQSIKEISLDSEYKSGRKVELNLKTNPEGCIVYLIPKIFFDQNPNMLEPKFKNQLEVFRTYEGYTPLTLIVEEYVYVVVFKKGKKGKYFTTVCKPKYSKKIENIFLNLEE